MDQPAKVWIAGVVIAGDGRGRELGFPTANLRLSHPLERPKDGIYACWAKMEDAPTQILPAVLHVGPRPTIPGASASVEVHIIGTSHVDLYGKTMYFSPVKKLREVEKFNSLDELTLAIQEDVRNALLFLKETPAFL